MMAADGGQAGNPTSITIFQAAQHGILDALQSMISSGQASPHDRDKDNVTALHWAAINNHLLIVQYLVSLGAEVDAIGGDLKSTPLHWAARQGHVQVMHFLLQQGADILAADGQGFSSLHLAAQYDHFFACLYLLLQGIPVDCMDREKRTPLMWAIYKSASGETLSLFLKFHANIDHIDIVRCSALHWGALKGNRFGCAFLIKEGANTEGKEEKGLTPLACAQEKGNGAWFQELLRLHQVEKSKYNKQFRNKMLALLPFVLIPAIFASFSFLPWYLGIPLIAGLIALARHGISTLTSTESVMHTPFQLCFFLASFTLVTLTYFFEIVLYAAEFPVLNALLLVLAFGAIYFLRKTTNCDPGNIPQAQPQNVQPLVLELISKNQLDRRHFCTTCFIRKPLRSKHDRDTDRCVALFDHYCPWVYNAVAVNNHKNFVLFIFCTCCCQIAYISLAIFHMNKLVDDSDNPNTLCFLPFHWCSYLVQFPWILLSIIWCGLNCAWQTLTLGSQIYQLSQGLTTNEYMNYFRYSYLTKPDPNHPGKMVLSNPFNQGLLGNWIDFCSSTSLNSNINWYKTYEVPKKEIDP